MRVSEIGRIAAFETRFAQAQATDVVNLSWGFALLQAEFPLSELHNRIVVASAAPVADVFSAAEEVLGGARIRHRYVTVVGDDLGQALCADFAAAGFEHETIATMVYDASERVLAERAVRAVSFEQLRRPALVRDWRRMLPDATDEHVDQLADRTRLAGRGAEVTLLAVYHRDEIVARAELYVDRVGRVAQVENLATHETSAVVVTGAPWSATPCGGPVRAASNCPSSPQTSTTGHTTGINASAFST